MPFTGCFAAYSSGGGGKFKKYTFSRVQAIKELEEVNQQVNCLYIYIFFLYVC